ncbi:vascular cell adhesion protein 1 [Sebastes fasciatus]|uniref:vascular cell adhesion protein 1 n=1 Tax=Sebastes fasciatus TaxID=394691 RepID=UPI003D9F1118
MGGRVAQSCWLLITLSLKGILAGDWSVRLPSSPICAVIGSSVVLPCSYDYPQSSNETKEEGRLSTQGGGGGQQGQQYKVLSEMWCLENSRCMTQRYVFHSAGIFPEPSYQNRVEYLGQPGTKNCSLRISDLRQSDSGSYVFYLITSHPTQKMPEQSGIQLLVAEVTSDDSGSYYCQIQTGDKVQNSTVLPVDVEYSPRNTAVSVSPAAELQDGVPVTLTCSSDANPPVQTYTWYQGAACLPAADKNLHQARRSPATPSGRGSTLSSASITTEDSGQHCCVASNRRGSQTESVTLTGSKGGRLIIIGVTVAVLLAIMALVAFLTRRRKPSRQQAYVLAETTATAP